MELENGRIYKNGFMTFVLICLDDDYWGMLTINKSAIENLSAPLFIHDGKGNFQFYERELIEKFNANKWKIMDGRLRIEKIDPTMRLVSYAIGGKLEELSMDKTNAVS